MWLWRNGVEIRARWHAIFRVSFLSCPSVLPLESSSLETIMIIERYGSEAHEMPGKKRLNLFLWSMSWMGQPKQRSHGERPWITAELRRCTVTLSNLARLIAGNRFMLCEIYQQTVSFNAEHSSSLQLAFSVSKHSSKGHHEALVKLQSREKVLKRGKLIIDFPFGKLFLSCSPRFFWHRNSFQCHTFLACQNGRA